MNVVFLFGLVSRSENFLLQEGSSPESEGANFISLKEVCEGLQESPRTESILGDMVARPDLER